MRAVGLAVQTSHFLAVSPFRRRVRRIGCRKTERKVLKRIDDEGLSWYNRFGDG